MTPEDKKIWILVLSALSLTILTPLLGGYGYNLGRAYNYNIIQEDIRSARVHGVSFILVSLAAYAMYIYMIYINSVKNEDISSDKDEQIDKLGNVFNVLNFAIWVLVMGYCSMLCTLGFQAVLSFGMLCVSSVFFALSLN